jgi:hypothetical protein
VLRGIFDRLGLGDLSLRDLVVRKLDAQAQAVDRGLLLEQTRAADVEDLLLERGDIRADPRRLGTQVVERGLGAGDVLLQPLLARDVRGVGRDQGAERGPRQRSWINSTARSSRTGDA